MQECYDGETPVRERGEGAGRLGVWADMTQVLLKVKEKGGGVEASQNAVLYLQVLSGCWGVLETTSASRGVQHLPGTGLH